jgi:hypothetical protein
MPPQAQSETQGGVMAHGFRWEAPPVSEGNPAKKRGKRRARPSAGPDAGDPRRGAWLPISVPTGDRPVAASAPGSDTQASATAARPTAGGEEVKGAAAEASGAPAEASEPGSPE